MEYNLHSLFLIQVFFVKMNWCSLQRVCMTRCAAIRARFFLAAWFPFALRSIEKNNKNAVIWESIYNRISNVNGVCVLIIFLSLGCNLALWYELNKKFCWILLYFPIQACGDRKPNGGHKYDDLQNWLHMTSNENPLFRKWSFIMRLLSVVVFLSYSHYHTITEKSKFNNQHIPLKQVHHFLTGT